LDRMPKEASLNITYVGLCLKKAGSCQAHYINSRKFEWLVIDRIKKHILPEENLMELVRLVNEEVDALTSKHRQQMDAFKS